MEFRAVYPGRRFACPGLLAPESEHIVMREAYRAVRLWPGSRLNYILRNWAKAWVKSVRA